MRKFVSTEGEKSRAYRVLASKSDRPDSRSPRSGARRAVAAAILSSLTDFVSPVHAQFTGGSGVATGTNSVAIDGVLGGGTGGRPPARLTRLPSARARRPPISRTSRSGPVLPQASQAATSVIRPSAATRLRPAANPPQ